MGDDEILIAFLATARWHEGQHRRFAFLKPHYAHKLPSTDYFESIFGRFSNTFGNSSLHNNLREVLKHQSVKREIKHLPETRSVWIAENKQKILSNIVLNAAEVFGFQ